MTTARGRDLRLELLCPLLLLTACIITFVTATRDEDFWWGDGASFALNGDFLRDYIASGLGRNPMAFALEWFHRYPALTISLYPPIFPLAEAAVFAIFGFSAAAAQATVTAFAVVACYGIYRMSGTVAGIFPATGAAIMLLATPEVARWSREIVMDIPAMAFLLLAGGAFLRYQSLRETKRLLLAVLAMLAAAYTKQTALFVVPAFAVALLADEGLSGLRRRSTWIGVAAGAIGLVPLAIFTALYATENFHIAFGSGTGQHGYDRLSIEALMAYGRALPEIVGIVPLVGSAAWLALVSLKGWRDTAERRLGVLMISWFIIDYLLVSVTATFETRYATLLTVPPVVLTILLISRLLAPGLAAGAALIVSVCMFAAVISGQPITRVQGYGDVAQYVLEQAAQDDVVLFHGMASKHFTFSIRTRSPTPRIFILRAEKFLVDYSITRDWGISDRGLTSGEVEAVIDRYHVAYIVFQPNFWTDQASIFALQRLIESDRFRLVARFGITSDDVNRETELRVYRTLHRPPAGGERGVVPPLFGPAVRGRI